MEWKGDQPDDIISLYRDGREAGVQREYIGKHARVIRRYMCSRITRATQQHA